MRAKVVDQHITEIIQYDVTVICPKSSCRSKNTFTYVNDEVNIMRSENCSTCGVKLTFKVEPIVLDNEKIIDEDKKENVNTTDSGEEE